MTFKVLVMSLIAASGFTLNAYIGYKVLGAIDVGKVLNWFTISHLSKGSSVNDVTRFMIIIDHLSKM
jgi:hypothetical protein